ncbi:hypothetical protein ACLBWX_01000 [Methylobacterium sp. M6A4_1b]
MDSLTELRSAQGLRMVKRITRDPSTGKLAIEDYDAGAYSFHQATHQVASIRTMATVLDTIMLNPTACVIRGEPKYPELQVVLRRKTHFDDVPRRWVLLDMENIPLPPGLDWRTEPEAAIRHAISLLPRHFHGVTCWWTFTGSQGVKKGPDGADDLRVRLAFWFDRPVSNQELKTWLTEKTPEVGKPRSSWRKIHPVDPSAFRVVQPNYIGRPVCDEGVTDPVPIRSGLLVGSREVVSIPMPIVPRTSGIATPTKASGPSKLSDEASISEPVTDPYKPDGSGFAYHVKSIGDGPGGQGFHDPMKAAVASWVGQNGPDADATAMLETIAAVARNAPRVESTHTAAYVERLILGLSTILEWVRTEERKRADIQSAVGSVCDPGRSLPTMSVAEASSALSAGVMAAFAEILPAAYERRGRVR